MKVSDDDLSIKLGSFPMEESAPISFYEGGRKLPCRFKLDGNIVSFLISPKAMITTKQW
jgi:hypothetical protein